LPRARNGKAIEVSALRRRVAVVGAGWAGLAAAVQATVEGHAVTLFEMARHGGGRARSVAIDGVWLDNGELEKLAGTEDRSVISDVLGLFGGKK